MKANKKTSRRALAHAANAKLVLGPALEGSVLPQIPRRWAWHYRTLLSLRDRLLQQGEGARGAVAQPLEPHSMDEADSASDEFDHDLGLSQLSAEQDALYEVDQALRRIREGTYGVCEESGQPIPAARLQAIPWARRTREAEARREEKGLARRPRLAEVKSVWPVGESELESGEETEGPPPKDEGLGEVYSPPGRHARPRTTAKAVARRGPRTTKKGSQP